MIVEVRPHIPRIYRARQDEWESTELPLAPGPSIPQVERGNNCEVGSTAAWDHEQHVANLHLSNAANRTCSY